MRIKTTPPQKPVNLLGQSYLNAKKPDKMRFKAALEEAGEKYKSGYWRRFNSYWQFTDKLNDLPSVILANAIEHLGYEFPPIDKANQKKG